MGKLEHDFAAYRERMNERILAEDNRVIKRIYSVDSLAAGARRHRMRWRRVCPTASSASSAPSSSEPPSSDTLRTWIEPRRFGFIA